MAKRIKEIRRTPMKPKPDNDERAKEQKSQYLENLGWRRWLIARLPASFGYMLSPFLCLHVPSLIIGSLLITLGLSLRILPRDYMSRHHGNDMTMIKPLMVGEVVTVVGLITALVYGLVRWLGIEMGLSIMAVIMFILWLWGFKLAVSTTLDEEHTFNEYLRTRDQDVFVEEIYEAPPRDSGRAHAVSTGWIENTAERLPRKKLFGFI